eukprot:6458194-Amphidinium_carterae.1
MRALIQIDCALNIFRGTLPQEWLLEGVALSRCSFLQNSFTGALPSEGLERLTRLTHSSFGTNSFTGSLPGQGFKSMTSLLSLLLGENRFAGAFPAYGFSESVRYFVVDDNCLTGSLPLDGLRHTGTLECLHIQQNLFTGLLPTQGLAFLSGLTHLVIFKNKFTGSLPSPVLLRFIGGVYVGDNYLQGTLPHGVRNLLAGGNLFTGSVPRTLGHAVVLTDMVHEGLLPASVCRFQGTASVVLGHGVAGAWPRVTSTFVCLSLWGNLSLIHI